MLSRRPPLGLAVPGLFSQQNREAHEAAFPPDPGASGTLHSCPRRHCRPLLSRPGQPIPAYNDRSDDTLARGHPHPGHDGGDRPASFPRILGLTVRSTAHSDFRPRCSIHLVALENNAQKVGHRHLGHHGLPTAGQRRCGMVPQVPKESPPLCRPRKPILVQIPTLGNARAPQRAEDGHGDLGGRNHIRNAPSLPGLVLSGRTIAPAIRSWPARSGQRRLLLTPIAGPAQVQRLTFRREGSPNGQVCVCPGRQTRKTEPCPQIYRPVQSERKALGQ